MANEEHVMNIPVKEYVEGLQVEFVPNWQGHVDVIYARNEDGYSGVRIDAKQLYTWLKKHYDSSKADDGRSYISTNSMF